MSDPDARVVPPLPWHARTTVQGEAIVESGGENEYFKNGSSLIRYAVFDALQESFVRYIQRWNILTARLPLNQRTLMALEAVEELERNYMNDMLAPWKTANTSDVSMEKNKEELESMEPEDDSGSSSTPGTPAASSTNSEAHSAGSTLPPLSVLEAHVLDVLDDDLPRSTNPSVQLNAVRELQRLNGRSLETSDLFTMSLKDSIFLRPYQRNMHQAALDRSSRLYTRARMQRWCQTVESILCPNFLEVNAHLSLLDAALHMEHVNVCTLLGTLSDIAFCNLNDALSFLVRWHDEILAKCAQLSPQKGSHRNAHLFAATGRTLGDSLFVVRLFFGQVLLRWMHQSIQAQPLKEETIVSILQCCFHIFRARTDFVESLTSKEVKDADRHAVHRCTMQHLVLSRLYQRIYGVLSQAHVSDCVQEFMIAYDVNQHSSLHIMELLSALYHVHFSVVNKDMVEVTQLFFELLWRNKNLVGKKEQRKRYMESVSGLLTPFIGEMRVMPAHLADKLWDMTCHEFWKCGEELLRKDKNSALATLCSVCILSIQRNNVFFNHLDRFINVLNTRFVSPKKEDAMDRWYGFEALYRLLFAYIVRFDGKDASGDTTGVIRTFKRLVHMIVPLNKVDASLCQIVDLLYLISHFSVDICMRLFVVDQFLEDTVGQRSVVGLATYIRVMRLLGEVDETPPAPLWSKETVEVGVVDRLLDTKSHMSQHHQYRREHLTPYMTVHDPPSLEQFVQVYEGRVKESIENALTMLDGLYGRLRATSQGKPVTLPMGKEKFQIAMTHMQMALRAAQYTKPFTESRSTLVGLVVRLVTHLHPGVAKEARLLMLHLIRSSSLMRSKIMEELSNTMVALDLEQESELMLYVYVARLAVVEWRMAYDIRSILQRTDAPSGRRGSLSGASRPREVAKSFQVQSLERVLMQGLCSPNRKLRSMCLDAMGEIQETWRALGGPTAISNVLHKLGQAPAAPPHARRPSGSLRRSSRVNSRRPSAQSSIRTPQSPLFSLLLTGDESTNLIQLAAKKSMRMRTDAQVLAQLNDEQVQLDASLTIRAIAMGNTYKLQMLWSTLLGCAVQHALSMAPELGMSLYKHFSKLSTLLKDAGPEDMSRSESDTDGAALSAASSRLAHVTADDVPSGSLLTQRSIQSVSNPSTPQGHAQEALGIIRTSRQHPVGAHWRNVTVLCFVTLRSALFGGADASGQGPASAETVLETTLKWITSESESVRDAISLCFVFLPLFYFSMAIRFLCAFDQGAVPMAMLEKKGRKTRTAVATRRNLTCLLRFVLESIENPSKIPEWHAEGGKEIRTMIVHFLEASEISTRTGDLRAWTVFENPWDVQMLRYNLSVIILSVVRLFDISEYRLKLGRDIRWSCVHYLLSQAGYDQAMGTLRAQESQALESVLSTSKMPESLVWEFRDAYFEQQLSNELLATEALSVIVSGSIFDEQMMTEDGFVFTWMDNIFSAGRNVLVRLVSQGLTRLLTVHAERSAVTSVVLSRCYRGHAGIANGYFRVLAKLCVDHVVQLNPAEEFVLACYKLSDVSVKIRNQSVTLLQHLVRTHSSLKQPVLALNVSVVPSVLSQQLVLSKQLSQAMDLFTLPVFDEVMCRIPVVTDIERRQLLRTLSPWLCNMTLYWPASGSVSQEDMTEQVESVMAVSHHVLSWLLVITFKLSMRFPEAVESLWMNVIQDQEGNVDLGKSDSVLHWMMQRILSRRNSALIQVCKLISSFVVKSESKSILGLCDKARSTRMYKFVRSTGASAVGQKNLIVYTLGGSVGRAHVDREDNPRARRRSRSFGSPVPRLLSRAASLEGGVSVKNTPDKQAFPGIPLKEAEGAFPGVRAHNVSTEGAFPGIRVRTDENAPVTPSSPSASSANKPPSAPYSPRRGRRPGTATPSSPRTSNLSRSVLTDSDRSKLDVGALRLALPVHTTNRTGVTVSEEWDFDPLFPVAVQEDSLSLSHVSTILLSSAVVDCDWPVLEKHLAVLFHLALLSMDCRNSVVFEHARALCTALLSQLVRTSTDQKAAQGLIDRLQAATTTLWQYEDLTSYRFSLESHAMVSQFVHDVLAVTSDDFCNGWREEAMRWVQDPSADRHYVARSLQVLRNLNVFPNDDMVSTILVGYYNHVMRRTEKDFGPGLEFLHNVRSVINMIRDAYQPVDHHPVLFFALLTVLSSENSQECLVALGALRSWLGDPSVLLGNANYLLTHPALQDWDPLFSGVAPLVFRLVVQKETSNVALQLLDVLLAHAVDAQGDDVARLALLLGSEEYRVGYFLSVFLPMLALKQRSASTTANMQHGLAALLRITLPDTEDLALILEQFEQFPDGETFLDVFTQAFVGHQALVEDIPAMCTMLVHTGTADVPLSMASLLFLRCLLLHSTPPLFESVGLSTQWRAILLPLRYLLLQPNHRGDMRTRSMLKCQLVRDIFNLASILSTPPLPPGVAPILHTEQQPSNMQTLNDRIRTFDWNDLDSRVDGFKHSLGSVLSLYGVSREVEPLPRSDSDSSLSSKPSSLDVSNRDTKKASPVMEPTPQRPRYSRPPTGQLATDLAAALHAAIEQYPELPPDFDWDALDLDLSEF